MSYFNTTNESGTTLKNNVAKAKSQEEDILILFKMITNQSPSEILLLTDYPITSIRRALTNLTKQGKLIKTDEKRIGMYGRSEYVWKLNEKQSVCNYCLELVDELPDKFGCKECIEKHK